MPAPDGGIRERRYSSRKCSRVTHANAQAARHEWTATGHSGSISQTLVSKQRFLDGPGRGL